MSDITYLYLGYTVVWAGLFLYIVKLHLDQRRLRRELNLLLENIHGNGKEEE